MPPKKSVVEEKLLLGRPSNNLTIGVVGLPNVGKSTFFNAITASSVAAENYPFCTIEPEQARVAVPDERFDWLCQLFKPGSRIPAYLSVTDVAGLVKGASGGAGLGNAFLSHIRALDGIFHVVRVFSDEDVTHVEGELDPVRDLAIIHEELRLKDVEFMQRRIEALERATANLGVNCSLEDKEKKEKLVIAHKILQYLDQDKKDIRKGDWANKEVAVINEFQLITAKPVIYLINLSQKDYIRKKNKWLPKIKNWVDENNSGDLMIPFCSTLEHELSKLDPEQTAARLEELGCTSALPKIVISGYRVLQLIYFFTAGPKEVRAWTIRRNTKAPQAGGVIHTDFEKYFVKVEVMKFADLKEYGSETAVKAAGRYLLRGKDYVVEDGDIIVIKANPPKR